MGKKQKKVAVVGAGKMGQMIARRLIETDLCRKEDICLTKGRVDAVPELKELFPGSQAAESNREAVKDAQIVFLCVRPQNFREAAKELKDELQPHQLVISIVTGTSFAQLEKGLGTSSLVRCSTNIGIEAGSATSCWMAHEDVTQKYRDLVKKIFLLWGDEVEVREETQLEIAIVGAGAAPAFVLEVMDNWLRAMLTAGMPRDLAEQVGRSVFARTTLIVQTNGNESLAELQKKVLTPGGITLRMLHLLDKRALRAAVVEAFQAAYERAQEFLKKNKEDEDEEDD